MKESNRGITLIALVITIIVLLILAGISIVMLTGENGIIGKAIAAKEENQKQTAIEIMNLKITTCQTSSYTENGETASLQYLADKLCEDSDIQYVELESKKIASLEKIDVSRASSIFTKIKKYPYEFEINGSLQLARINGVKIATQETENNENLKLEIENLKDKISSLEQEKNSLNSQVSSLEQEKNNLNSQVSNLKEEKNNLNTILNQTNATARDILLGKKAWSNGKLITGEHTEQVSDGKGVYWNSGGITMTAGSTINLNIGFNPRYIVFTNRTNGSSVLYNKSISSDSQYVNGGACSLPKEGTSIISVNSTVVFRSNYDLTWDWIALP